MQLLCRLVWRCDQYRLPARLSVTITAGADHLSIAGSSERPDQADHLSSSRRASSSFKRSAMSAATDGSSVFAIGVPSCFLTFCSSAVTGKSWGLSGFFGFDIASLLSSASRASPGNLRCEPVLSPRTHNALEGTVTQLAESVTAPVTFGSEVRAAKVPEHKAASSHDGTSSFTDPMQPPTASLIGRRIAKQPEALALHILSPVIVALRLVSSSPLNHHSPKIRSGPSALAIRCRTLRQMKNRGGASGISANALTSSGDVRRRDGRGRSSGQFASLAAAIAGTRFDARSGSSLSTGTMRKTRSDPNLTRSLSTKSPTLAFRPAWRHAHPRSGFRSAPRSRRR